MRNRMTAVLGITFLLSLGSCQTLQQVAQNLPPAEIPRLYAPADQPPVPAIQSATTITHRNGPLQITGLQTAGACPGNNTGPGPHVPLGSPLVVNIFKRSLTEIDLTANGVPMRQPENDDQERWWTDAGQGYYYLDKEWGTRSEVNDLYDDERLAIVLPNSVRDVRPLTLEIRNVSNNANFQGTQKISDPLMVVIPQCPDFRIAIRPLTDLPQGGTEQLAVNIVRVGGFNQAINLNLTITPTGVSAAQTAPVVAAGQSSLETTVSAARTAALGVYQVRVVGTAAGFTREALATGRVVQADFTLNVPALPNVIAGRQVTFQTTIARNSGLVDPVTLEFMPTGWPQSVTSTFAPQQLTGNQLASTATIAAGSSAVPNSYNVTLRATGGGVTKTHQATLRVAAVVASDPFLDVDCLCDLIGDYVPPAPPVEGNASPDGRFNLVQTPASSGITLQLRHTTNNACMVTPGTVSAHAQFGFSPHGKYFMVADRPQTNLRILFYRLDCDPQASVPRIFEQALYLPPGDEWDVSTWGFSPDTEDRTFAFAGLKDASRVDYTIVNLKALMSNQLPQQHLLASISQSSAGPIYFSPCGDIAMVKQSSNNTSLTLNFTRTRNFQHFATSGTTISSTNLDANAFVAADQHKLRIVRSSGAPVEQNILSNTSNEMCPL